MYVMPCFLCTSCCRSIFCIKFVLFHFIIKPCGHNGTLYWFLKLPIWILVHPGGNVIDLVSTINKNDLIRPLTLYSTCSHAKLDNVHFSQAFRLETKSVIVTSLARFFFFAGSKMDNGSLSRLRVHLSRHILPKVDYMCKFLYNYPWSNFGLSALLKGTIATCCQ